MRGHAGEEKLRAFVNALPDLLFVLDEDGRYVEALCSDESLLYASARELVGRRMHDVLPRDKADLFLRTIRRTLASRRSQILEYDLAVPAGVRFFEGRTSPLPTRIRGRRAIVWVSRDVTEHRRLDLRLRRQMAVTRRAYGELKRAQSQLVMSEKFAAIGVLVAGVAHEINNPLNVIYGNLRLLSERRGGRARAGRRMLRDALDAAEQMKAVVEEFRNFGRERVPAEAADLSRCLEGALGALGGRALSRVRVVRRFGRLPPVRCVRDQIHQALLNVVRNAVEAMGGRGTLTLRTLRRGACVVAEVGDTGRGIPAELRGRIFEPFTTTKPAGRGLGLGLSIAAMIVHRHGGRIAFRSRAGRGTVFAVTLPVGAP